jgi:hypothetical protein
LFGSIGLKTEQESSRGRMGWFHLLHSKRVDKTLLESKQFNKKMYSVITGHSSSWATSYFKQKRVHTIFGQHPSSAETETATS